MWSGACNSIDVFCPMDQIQVSVEICPATAACFAKTIDHKSGTYQHPSLMSFKLSSYTTRDTDDCRKRTDVQIGTVREGNRQSSVFV
jgi:hypothetical protein